MSSNDQDDVSVKTNLLMVLINDPTGFFIGLDLSTESAESKDGETEKGA